MTAAIIGISTPKLPALLEALKQNNSLLFSYSFVLLLFYLLLLKLKFSSIVEANYVVQHNENELFEKAVEIELSFEEH